MRVVITTCLLLAVLAGTMDGFAQTAQSYYHTGTDKFAAKDYQGAIAAFGNAVSMEPRYSDAWYFRGLAKSMIKDSTAADDFTRVLEIDPKRANAWYFRGSVRYRRKDYAAAISDCSRAISLSPGMSEAWFLRGSSNIGLKNYYAAVADLDKAVSLRDDYVAAVYMRGFARYRLQKYTEALHDFIKTIDLDPGYAVEAWFFRGMCRVHLNQQALACPDFEKAANAGVADAIEMKKKYCR